MKNLQLRFSLYCWHDEGHEPQKASRPGEVYRRQDSRLVEGVDRHLKELVEEGRLPGRNRPLSLPQGDGVRESAPGRCELVASFLKEHHFLLLRPTPTTASASGRRSFTTRRLSIIASGTENSRSADVCLIFGLSRSRNSERGILLVDLVNNLDQLAESRDEVLTRFKQRVLTFDGARLERAAGDYGTVRTKKFFHRRFANRMPIDYLHITRNSDLIRIVAQEKGIDPALVEKDYWIMHGLYGLQKLSLKFELKGAPRCPRAIRSSTASRRHRHSASSRRRAAVKPGKNHTKLWHIESRRKFYDWLAEMIRTKASTASARSSATPPRQQAAFSGGIRLSYNGLFRCLRPERGRVLRPASDVVTPTHRRISAPGPTITR